MPSTRRCVPSRRDHVVDSVWRQAADLAEDLLTRPHTTSDGWDIVQALAERADTEEFGWVGGLPARTDIVVDTLASDVVYNPRTRRANPVNEVKRHG